MKLTLISTFLTFVVSTPQTTLPEITLLSNVLEDGTVRTLPNFEGCVTTIYGNGGNNHLEIVPCKPYGSEIITEDMLFRYADLCWQSVWKSLYNFYNENKIFYTDL